MSTPNPTSSSPPTPHRSESASIQPGDPSHSVEMETLPSAAIAKASSSTPPANTSSDPSFSQTQTQEITTTQLPPTLSDSPEAPAPIEPAPAVAEPAITITLLLPSGKRYPYTLNAKYLRKRKDVVQVQDDDPSKVTVLFMKLLLMHDWKEEWADKPQTADKIRLIYFGRMLEDSATLKDCKLDASVGPNVVHMSIRPPESVEEEADPKQASHVSRERGRSACCSCAIM